jgi:hypothetical protein
MSPFILMWMRGGWGTLADRGLMIIAALPLSHQSITFVSGLHAIAYRAMCWLTRVPGRIGKKE